MVDTSLSLDRFAGSALELVVLRDAGTTWVDLWGEADIAACTELRACLAAIELDGVHVHLMLGRLTFCDLHALRVLSEFVRDARLRAETCTVHDLPPSVWRLVKLVGLDIG